MMTMMMMVCLRYCLYTSRASVADIVRRARTEKTVKAQRRTGRFHLCRQGRREWAAQDPDRVHYRQVEKTYHLLQAESGYHEEGKLESRATSEGAWMEVDAQAYELSILTGTQVLLLVVSETGLVYTFTTTKLQPLVQKPEGKNLIQVCRGQANLGAACAYA